MKRRACILLPPLLAGCAGTAPPPPPLRRPDGYSYLTPIRLNLAELEIVQPEPGAAFRADPPAPLVPLSETLRMARDRLSAVGSEGRARFTVEAASLTRERTAAGGMFSSAQERVTCAISCRLSVLGAAGAEQGFATAEVRRSVTASPSATAAERLVAQAMDDLNIEFEFQVRRNLRPFIAETTPTDTPSGGVQREELPRS